MKDTGINTFSGKPRWDWSKPKSHKSKALKEKKDGYTDDKGIRHLSKKEQAEKTKNWPKSTGHTDTDKEKREYQNKYKKAWNE